MKTQAQLKKIFGDPYVDQLKFERGFMILWDIPQWINDAIPVLPNKIYVNKFLPEKLEATFAELIEKGLHKEIRSYDGVFNVRKKRGSSSISTHAWGIAIDLNAAWNPFKGRVTWSKAFLEVWRKHGWICGADWSPAYVDGMHFQGDNFF